MSEPEPKSATGPISAPRLRPVLLSGGVGARLWPLSRAAAPKQLIALASELTMLQATVLRASDTLLFAAPVIVASAAHQHAIRTQVAALAMSIGRLILEPCARNTAPAIALAALDALETDPEAILLVMPSDHLIADGDAFLAAVQSAMDVALQGWLITFGITPDAPETGYGYIEIGALVADGVHRVSRFVEKPDRATAQTYIAQGNFAWNGGIFLFQAKALAAAMAEHAPAMLAACRAAVAQGIIAGDTLFPDAAAFAACPSDSIDCAVFEPAAQASSEAAARVAVVPVAMGWSDIGSWDALYAVGDKTDAGNVVSGARVISVDSHDCLLRSDGPIIAAVGITGLNIIATDDAVLITARGRAQEVKAVVDALRGDPALRSPRREHHDWGSLKRLTEADGIAVEEISIAAGATWPGAAGQLTLLDGEIAHCAPGVPNTLLAPEPLTAVTAARLLLVRNLV